MVVMIVVCQSSVVKLVPDTFVVTASSVLFIELHDINHCLWMLFLFFL